MKHFRQSASLLPSDHRSGGVLALGGASRRGRGGRPCLLAINPVPEAPLNHLIRAAATATIIFVLGACGSAADESTGTSDTAATSGAARATSTSTLAADSAFAQLCGVLGAALAGDTEEARATFDHGPLHTLADDALQLDRGVAARLLEAKEAVESAMADTSTGSDEIAVELEALVDASARAYALVDNTPPPTCEELR